MVRVRAVEVRAAKVTAMGVRRCMVVGRLCVALVSLLSDNDKAMCARFSSEVWRER
jgi:hypothetical protein